MDATKVRRARVAQARGECGRSRRMTTAATSAGGGGEGASPVALSEVWIKVEELLKKQDPENEPYK